MKENLSLHALNEKISMSLTHLLGVTACGASRKNFRHSQRLILLPPQEGFLQLGSSMLGNVSEQGGQLTSCCQKTIGKFVLVYSILSFGPLAHQLPRSAAWIKVRLRRIMQFKTTERQEFGTNAFV